MSYFKRFPVIAGYEIDHNTVNMMDITRRTGFLANIQNNDALYFSHVIQDGESPIVLADRVYDDGDLYWVIMMFNNIYDINSDWPLDQLSLTRYIARMYNDPNGVHHYESIASGAIVDSDWVGYDLLTVTNTEYETKQNDIKRNIKIPVPQAVNNLVKEHNRLIEQ